jgi:hypothetical protein
MVKPHCGLSEKDPQLQDKLTEVSQSRFRLMVDVF